MVIPATASRRDFDVVHTRRKVEHSVRASACEMRTANNSTITCLYIHYQLEQDIHIANSNNYVVYKCLVISEIFKACCTYRSLYVVIYA